MHIPRLVRSGVALPKSGAREQLVLARVNGKFTVAEIASFVGMPFEEALAILQGFALRGVVELVAPSDADRLLGGSPADRASSRPSMPMAPPRGAKIDEGPPSGMYSVIDEDAAKARSMRPPSSPQGTAVKAPPPLPGGKSSPSVDETVDIDEARRQEIQRAYDALTGANHYGVLGVHPTAPKADIRAAYFDLSKRFHPDSLYGKRLGAYKGKMEAVFKRVTEAYEVLGKAKRRDEYDRYLNLRAENQFAQESLRLTEEAAEVIESESQARAHALPKGMGKPAAKASDPAVTAPPAAPPSAPAVTTPPRPAPSRSLSPHRQAKAVPSVQLRPSAPPSVRTGPGTTARPSAAPSSPIPSAPPSSPIPSTPPTSPSMRPAPKPSQAPPSMAPPRPSQAPLYNSGFTPTAADRAMEKLTPSAPPVMMEPRATPAKRSVRPSKRPARLPSGSGLAAPIGSVKPPQVSAAPPAPSTSAHSAPPAQSQSGPPTSSQRPAVSQPAPRVAVPPPGRPLKESDQDRRRRMVAQQLAQATGRKLNIPPPAADRGPASPATPSAAPPRNNRASLLPPNSVPPERREHLLRDLAKSLKTVAVYTGGVDRAQAHLEDAKRAEAKGDLLGAANALRLAGATTPERDDIQLEYDRVSGLLAATLADKYQEQAKMEESQGSWQEASLSWSKVCDGRPDDPVPHLQAAEAMVKADLPLADAKRFAQRAVDLQPDNVRALKLLGQIFIGAGMKLNARKALEAAAKLDPKDEVVKNLLKEAK